MSASARQWSEYQQAIFRFVESGTGNAVVEAVAGSGKTTTIVEALSRVRGTSIFLAFNKKIADELKARGVNARTFHSLTFSPVTRARRASGVEANKLRNLVEEHWGQADVRDYGAFACRLVGLARQAGMGCLIPDAESHWLALVEHHGLEPDSENATIERGVDIARELLTLSNASAFVDFDDLLYLAVRDGIPLPKFDFVFVDEAQDTNAIQRALLRKILRPGARVVAVGDPAQAIYGFRGADSESLGLIAQEFNACRLPLTVSYRCPRAVVEHARQWVAHIECSPTAPEGSVADWGTKWGTDSFRPADLLVCRTTRPLIALAYRLLCAHVPVSIAGRDLGQNLKALVTRMRATTLERLDERLVQYTEREVEKAIARKQEERAEAIRDKTEAIRCLIDGMPEGDRTVAALLAVIDRLFTERANAVQLSTIHKAKGLEADRVFWLNSSACPSRWAHQDWQVQQEYNLCYVATTRARHELVLIEDK